MTMPSRQGYQDKLKKNGIALPMRQSQMRVKAKGFTEILASIVVGLDRNQSSAVFSKMKTAPSDKSSGARKQFGQKNSPWDRGIGWRPVYQILNGRPDQCDEALWEARAFAVQRCRFDGRSKLFCLRALLNQKTLLHHEPSMSKGLHQSPPSGPRGTYCREWHHIGQSWGPQEIGEPTYWGHDRWRSSALVSGETPTRNHGIRLLQKAAENAF